MLNITIETQEIVTFQPTDMIDMIDFRPSGYYKVKQGVVQQNLSHYHIESANTICDQFNRLLNMLKEEEKKKGNDKYPWLDDSNERKYMTGREILNKIYQPGKLSLDKKKEVRELLYEYKDLFSLRDKIGTCPGRNRHYRQDIFLYKTISC